MNRSEPNDPIKGRPVFHFTAPAHWLNDPNGLVYVEGQYHLFFQHNPDEDSFGPPHWGHATSRDLIGWRHLPIALHPDELGVIFSGSAVIDEFNTAGFGAGVIVAAFTHHLEDGVERQSLAYSRDAGMTWHKYRSNPVLEAPPGVRDFRDPRVFRWGGDEDGHWVMLLAVGVAVWIYVSDDLINWERASVFEPDPTSARVWECPELIELPVQGTEGSAWMMSIGVDAPGGSQPYGTRYFVGTFDGRRFTQRHTAPHMADYGADFYAPQAWTSAPDDRKIWIGWMNNWRYAGETPTEGWRGAMSIPRELHLVETRDGWRLIQSPVPELQRWRTPLVEGTDVSVVGDRTIDEVHGTALDIVLTVDVKRSTAREFRIAVRVGEEESTDVVVDLQDFTISVDRYRSGRHELHRAYSGPRLASFSASAGCLELRLLVDVTSVEVFAGGGVVVITEQIFPSLESDGLRLVAIDGEVVLPTFDVHAIEPPVR